MKHGVYSCIFIKRVLLPILVAFSLVVVLLVYTKWFGSANAKQLFRSSILVWMETYLWPSYSHDYVRVANVYCFQTL